MSEFMPEAYGYADNKHNSINVLPLGTIIEWISDTPYKSHNTRNNLNKNQYLIVYDIINKPLWQGETSLTDMIYVCQRCSRKNFLPHKGKSLTFFVWGINQFLEKGMMRIVM